MRKKSFSFLLLLLIVSTGFSQSISPNGQFLKDSVQIGEPIEFALSIKYPKGLEIIFPDSLYDFSPFELTKKTYFPTQSDSLFSRDSTIYYLSTFEIDSVQYLKLPIYKINEYDSLIFWTTLDSVILKHAVEIIPDSITMVTNTNYVEVPIAFNYPYASIALIIIGIIALVIWLVFGKTVIKKLAIYRIKKRNTEFLLNFDNLVANHFLSSEEILFLWKSYLEKLLDKPFTKLTSKEITSLLTQDNLGASLIAIDRNIYGPKDESLLSDAYKNIKEVAKNEYLNKVNQIANG